MKVRFTPLASRQLEDLHAYISLRSNEATADGYIGRIVSFCRGLDTFPSRGTRRDDILAGLRTVGFERRLTIAFLVDAEAVLIEGVFYGGRDFEAILRDSR